MGQSVKKVYEDTGTTLNFTTPIDKPEFKKKLGIRYNDNNSTQKVLQAGMEKLVEWWKKLEKVDTHIFGCMAIDDDK